MITPRTRLLVVIGAGGHAVSVSNVAHSAGFEIKYYVDRKWDGRILPGGNILDDIDSISNIDQYDFCIAIGDNAVREQVHSNLLNRYSTLTFPALIHSSAIIADSVAVGDGTIVMPGVIVGPNTMIGKFCILNSGSSIDHECTMQDYSSLAPGAITGGSVSIGARSAISIGAVVKHGLTIGNDCVLGAHSYLNRDLRHNQLAYGSPARIVRSRDVGDPYLK